MSGGRTPTFGPMRQTIVCGLTHSKQTAPRVNLSTEIQMDALIDAVEHHNAGRDRDSHASVAVAA